MSAPRHPVTTARSIGRAAVVGALALPLALLGCSAGGGDDVAVSSGPGSGSGYGSGTARAAGHLAERAANQGLVLPLDAYAFSGEEARVIGQAAEAEVRACFEEYGFAPADADPLPLGDSDGEAAPRHARRYAVADAEVAAAYGYHPPPSRDVRREFYEGHTDDELLVLVGAVDGDELVASRYQGRVVPDGGCLGQVTAGIAAADEAGRRAGEELVSEIQADAWHKTLRDPRTVDAFEIWSQCLAEAGYEYDAPMQANDDPAWQTPAALAPEEIATATADVACKDKTALVPVWSTVEGDHQARLIAEHQAELGTYRAVLDDAVADARALLDR